MDQWKWCECCWRGRGRGTEKGGSARRVRKRAGGCKKVGFENPNPCTGLTCQLVSGRILILRPLLTTAHPSSRLKAASFLSVAMATASDIACSRSNFPTAPIVFQDQIDLLELEQQEEEEATPSRTIAEVAKRGNVKAQLEMTERSLARKYDAYAAHLRGQSLQDVVRFIHETKNHLHSAGPAPGKGCWLQFHFDCGDSKCFLWATGDSPFEWQCKKGMLSGTYYTDKPDSVAELRERLVAFAKQERLLRAQKEQKDNNLDCCGKCGN